MKDNDFATCMFVILPISALVTDVHGSMRELVFRWMGIRIFDGHRAQPVWC